MNDTIVIARLPGTGPELWLVTALHRYWPGERNRAVASGGREEAVKLADKTLWVYRINHEGEDASALDG